MVQAVPVSEIDVLPIVQPSAYYNLNRRYYLIVLGVQTTSAVYLFQHKALFRKLYIRGQIT